MKNTLIFSLALTGMGLTLPLPARGQQQNSAQDPQSDNEPPTQPAPPSTPALDLPTTSDDDASSAGDEVSLAEWNQDDWSLVKPRSQRIVLNGYFRLRAGLFRKLGFNNDSQWEQRARFRPVATSGANRRADFSTTNMRLRVEPQINITDDIQIVSTVDVLDNIVFGSTPNSVSSIVNDTPNNVGTRTQLPPSDGNNAITDSIVIKRAYARVTALNEQLELRFGRMPNHWGLGMMANSGDCLDCDFGDSVDRVQLSFKAVGHIFTPMLDWVSNGPIATPFGRSGGQPLDAATWDDVFQYSIQISKRDHPEDIAEATARGETVVNYGLWNMLRRQSRDLGADFYADGYDPTKEIDIDFAAGGREEQRKASIYTGNAFVELYSGKLKLAGEAAIISGSFKDTFADPGGGTVDATTDIFQVGAALELDYNFDGDFTGTTLSLKTGAASGDSAPGFGALDQADSQRGFFPGPNGAVLDSDLNNFQFSPNYHVDLLMFRRIVGTVTDAWYVSPQVAYAFDEKINGRFSVTYAQAMLSESTASCLDPTSRNDLLCRGNTPKGDKGMGLEFDAELAYGLLKKADGGAFRASLAGGILFPFGGFNNGDSGKSGSFAWTIQTRLYITY